VDRASPGAVLEPEGEQCDPAAAAIDELGLGDRLAVRRVDRDQDPRRRAAVHEQHSSRPACGVEQLPRSEVRAVRLCERRAVLVGELAILAEAEQHASGGDRDCGRHGCDDRERSPEEPAPRRRWVDRTENAELEADRRLLLGRQGQQPVGDRRLSLELAPALRAVGDVLERRRALGPVGDPER